MVSVVIAALSGTASIGTAGLMDALNKADLAAGLQAGRPGPRVFDVRHLQHARIQHAKRLLETAGDPVDQVRRQAGYDDPAAFRRVFKQATGLSPRGYRDAYGLR